VYACVRTIAHTATQALLSVERAGQPIEVPIWLYRPDRLNGGIRSRELIERATVDLGTRGVAGWDALPVGSSSWSLTPIAAHRIGARFDLDGVRVWTVDGVDRQLVDGDGRRGGLLVVPFLTVSDRAEPLGPLQAARSLIGGFLDTEAYAANLFRSGAGTGPRLEADTDLPETTAQRWRDYWIEQHSDPATSTIPVLGAGLRLATDLIDPTTAAWIDARRYNATEVARLFGVPGRRVGLPSGDSVTYATAQDDDAAFMRYTVSAYTDPIADAWTQLLPSGRNATEDTRVVFDWRRLLNPTPGAQIDYLTTAVAGGLMTVEEARTQLGLPELMPELEAAQTTEALA
jgi:HK97 family phage portal protein